MSDSFLRLIPTTPGFVPSAEARTTAVEHVRGALPSAEAVDARITDDIVFVDAGANFEAVSCPLCDAQLDQDWWGAEVGRAAGTEFVDLAVKVPCCNGQTTLNELTYEMPQGFARSVIEATNPNVDELPSDLVRTVAGALETEVRVIWARY